MKIPVLLLLLIIAPFISSAKLADRSGIDSLLAELSSPRFSRSDDTAKVLLLRSIAAQYELINHDSGKMYLQRALKIAEDLSYKHGQALCYMTQARCFSSGHDNCLELTFKALKLFEQEKNDSLISWAYHEIAGVYFNMKKYPQALEYFQKGQKKFTGNERSVAIANLNIGATYGEMGDHASALAYESVALKSALASENEKDQATVLQNMANGYAALKQYNKALADAYRSMQLFKKLGLEYYYYAGILNDVGYIHFLIAQDSAFIVRPDSLLPPGKAANLAKAIEYLTASIDVYKAGYTPADALKKLSGALAAGGSYQEALQLYIQYTKQKEDELSKDVELKIAAQETGHEADLKQRQIALNELLVKQKSMERRLYALGILGLLVIVGLTVRNTVRQKKQNTQLALEKDRSDRLVTQKDELLGQKDILMKEIHHRVKNNLQVITALMDLQLENVADQHTQKEIKESISRIKSISLIHHQLYQGQQVAGIAFSAFAQELALQVGAAFKQPGQNVAVVIDMHETILDIDTAMPLGLILNELMTNSYKYAFAGKDGSIKIELKQASHGYSLLYADSGPGLPAGYELSKSATLGMMLIDSLSRQLGGSVHYHRQTQQFVIEFRDITERKKTA